MILYYKHVVWEVDMKIDSKLFLDFLNRITIGTMIEEVTFTPNQGSISVLIADKRSRIVIKGTCEADTANISPFTVPSLSKLSEAVKTLFPAEITVSIFSDLLTLESDSKTIKLELVQPTIYPALSNAVSINRNGNTIEFTSRGETISYSDSILIPSKDMVKYFKECLELVPSSKVFYNFDGTDHYLTSNHKKNNIKIKLSNLSQFNTPKSIWMFNFIQEIFKKNPINTNLYINTNTDPIVITYRDSNFDIITVSTPYCEDEE